MTFDDLQLVDYTQLCKLFSFKFLFCLIVVVYCYLGGAVPFKTFHIFLFLRAVVPVAFVCPLYSLLMW